MKNINEKIDILNKIDNYLAELSDKDLKGILRFLPPSKAKHYEIVTKTLKRFSGDLTVNVLEVTHAFPRFRANEVIDAFEWAKEVTRRYIDISTTAGLNSITLGNSSNDLATVKKFDVSLEKWYS